MTTQDPGTGLGPATSANVGRGIAVIMAAILVGLFLMARGVADGDLVAADDGASTSSEPPSDGAVSDDEADDDDATTDTTQPEDTITTVAETTDDTDTDTDTDGETTDDTLGAQLDPAQVVTLAVNATEPLESGIASATRDKLQSAGYGVAAPANADTNSRSRIIFSEGYESNARAIAELFGVDPAAVLEPFDAASSPVNDTRSSNIIVVAGSDGVIRP